MSEHTWAVLAAEAEKDGSKLAKIVAALCRAQSMQYPAKVCEGFELTPPPVEKPDSKFQSAMKKMRGGKGKKR